MSRIGIKFQWESIILNNSIEIAEYFYPYKPEVVRPLLIENSQLRRQIDKVFQNEELNYSLTELYIENQKRNVSYLGEIEEYSWSNNEYDYNESSLWDYLMDISTVTRAYKLQNSEDTEFKYRGNQLAGIEMQARIKLDLMKFDLSILEYCNWDNNNAVIENDIVRFYKWVTKFLDSYKVNTNVLDIEDIQAKKIEFLTMNLNEKLNTSIEKVMDWIQLLVANIGVTDVLRKDIISQIGSRLTNLPEDTGVFYAEKKKYIKQLNSNYALGYDKYSLFPMILSNNLFELNKQKIFNEIIDNTVRHLNTIPQCDDPLFEDKFKDLNKFLIDSSNPLRTKMVAKYGVDSEKCFALIVESDGKKYFSFSGLGDHVDAGDVGKFNNLALLIVNEAFKVRPKASLKNIRKLCGVYRWSYLTDETLRFTDLVSNMNRPVQYISIPIKFGNDILSVKMLKKKYGRTYSCCERKIFTQSDPEKDKVLFVRWAPCKLCIPALMKEKGDVSIFAYSNNFKSWESEGKPSLLKKFKITTQYETIEE